ncbi:LOW QUALITY PROTEIN: phosphatidylinositol polyphosphate 5-phosphatase type IV-like [Liolophura sinensis]|uniref:LOW QUALITY PROTEIN: phosphatidylinositol polyphosphate 5-phosphatase type IV-like n=1 Tax=Liolophura sinensis TaxID=3198878 RepID=UPI003158E7CC
MTSENTGDVDGEERPAEISIVTQTSPFSTPRSGRKKKKGALAKLAEKKRRAQAGLSDVESNYGSLVSLQPDVDINGLDQNHEVSAFSKGGISEHLSDDLRRQENEALSSVWKQSSDVAPAIKPRLSLSNPRSHAAEDFSSGKINSRTSATEASDPSSTPLYKLRALKMTPSRSSSVESLKNSPFSPRPPMTPRKTPPDSPQKDQQDRDTSVERVGSTRLNDASLDQKRFIKADKTVLGSDLPNSDIVILNNQKPDTHSFVQQKKTLTSSVAPEKRTITSGNTTATNEHFDSVDSSSAQHMDTASELELQGVSNEYHKILEKNTLERDTRQASSSLWGGLSARTGRLTPLSPKHPPPPLSADYSSRALRTANRTDSGFQMQKFLGHAMGQLRGSKGSDTIGHSETSTSALPLITTKEAKTRSYLLGSINNNSALLGAEELDRYFPDRKLHIFVGSWNMAEMKDCSLPIDDFLLPDSSDFVQDIYVIGTQENSANKKEWEIRMQETLGPSHVLFHSATHGALHLAVFIRRDLIWFCSGHSDVVSTRAVTMVKTKGAVAISFTFFGTSLLFINSHFTCDDSRMKDRIVDYKKIIRELKLSKKSASSSPNSASQVDITKKFDAVFWCGDLNFRISRKRDHVEDILEFGTSQVYPNYEKLIASDQLTNCINDGQIFLGFQEGRIGFQPTYKFDINSDKYDTSHKLRIPSYTDRVLFRSKKKNSISCVLYDAVMTIRASDHRPVFGLFETALRPGRDNIPLAAGQFDRSVYVEANRRRALHRAALSKKSSTICSLQ